MIYDIIGIICVESYLHEKGLRHNDTIQKALTDKAEAVTSLVSNIVAEIMNASESIRDNILSIINEDTADIFCLKAQECIENEDPQFYELIGAIYLAFKSSIEKVLNEFIAEYV